MTPRDCYNLVHPGDEYAWANLPADAVERWKVMHAAVIASVMSESRAFCKRLRLSAETAEDSQDLYDLAIEAADFLDGHVR